MSTPCDFGLAIVKGLVEHGEAGVYFGSLLGLDDHLMQAHARGLVAPDESVCGWKLTKAGRNAYSLHRLDLLPKSGRTYAWDWSVTT